MMQHDLKWHESRLTDPWLVGWCICGSWYAQSQILDRSLIVKSFLVHLDDVGEQRLTTWADKPGLLL